MCRSKAGCACIYGGPSAALTHVCDMNKEEVIRRRSQASLTDSNAEIQHASPSFEKDEFVHDARAWLDGTSNSSAGA